MDREQVKSLFENLNVWKRGGEHAPHKVLLTLFALGRCYQKQSRFTSYEEVDDGLKRLLTEFGPGRKNHHPEYPFWRLQNDGVWQLQGADMITLTASGDAKKADLLRFRVQGGFTEEVYSALSRDHNLVIEIAINLVESNFAPSLHEELLRAVGINLQGRESQFKGKHTEVQHFFNAALRLVKDRKEIETSMAAFNQELCANKDLGCSILRASRYWVHDAASGTFGASKFVAFRGMNFIDYARARNNDADGDPFNGTVARRAIEKILGSFMPDSWLSYQLFKWGEAKLGGQAFGGSNPTKWKFTVLKNLPEAQDDPDDDLYI